MHGLIHGVNPRFIALSSKDLNGVRESKATR